MKILGLIPARGGSKGIPRKNIKLLQDKPLLQYSFEAAQGSRLLDKIILSSEDEEIISLANKIGLETPFKRPKELAQDTTGSLEVIQHALKFYEQKGVKFDAVCLLQPTTPFRNDNLIDTCIKKFKTKDCDSLISVRQVPEEYNPHWIFVEKNGLLQLATGEKNIIPRRQELPPAYFRDGAIYLTKTETLLEQNSLFGNKIGLYDTTGSPYANIDTPADWEEAEKILNGCAE